MVIEYYVRIVGICIWILLPLFVKDSVWGRSSTCTNTQLFHCFSKPVFGNDPKTSAGVNKSTLDTRSNCTPARSVSYKERRKEHRGYTQRKTWLRVSSCGQKNLQYTGMRVRTVRVGASKDQGGMKWCVLNEFIRQKTHPYNL